MIEILQWSTLAACGLVAVARVPSALRGKNRTLFYIFALMTLAILLSIEAPYVAIDQALGGINLANLILRLVIFAAIYFVGIRITKGFGADDAYRLITGGSGWPCWRLTSLIVVVVFLMMDTAGSSAGMVAVSRQGQPQWTAGRVLRSRRPRLPGLRVTRPAAGHGARSQQHASGAGSRVGLPAGRRRRRHWPDACCSR